MKTLKFTFIALVAILFSGCSLGYTDQLENQNMRQTTIIQQQQQQLKELQDKLQGYQQKERAIKEKKEARIRWIAKQKKLKAQKKRQTTQATTSKRPTISSSSVDKNGLKKVEDTNYSSNYMYPKAKRKVKKVTTSSSITMSKSECISMITQARFDKYTSMFGTQGAIKRCRMLKAMR